MALRRGFLRGLVLLWAVLQLAVPTMAVAADAAATSASVGAYAHVEATTGTSCIRVHDAECIFCQFLSTGAAPAASPVPDIPVVVAIPQAFEELAAPRRGALRGIAVPRAPPAV
jgi:hypothetical protein